MYGYCLCSCTQHRMDQFHDHSHFHKVRIRWFNLWLWCQLWRWNCCSCSVHLGSSCDGSPGYSLISDPTSLAGGYKPIWQNTTFLDFLSIYLFIFITDGWWKSDSSPPKCWALSTSTQLFFTELLMPCVSYHHKAPLKLLMQFNSACVPSFDIRLWACGWMLVSKEEILSGPSGCMDLGQIM